MKTQEEKLIKLLEQENNVLKKQNALYHNAFMEINILTAMEMAMQDKMYKIISTVQSTRINVAKVKPQCNIIIT